MTATIFLSDSLSRFAISTESIPFRIGPFVRTSLMGPRALAFFSSCRTWDSSVLAVCFSSSLCRTSLWARSAFADLGTWSGVVFKSWAVVVSSSFSSLIRLSAGIPAEKIIRSTPSCNLSIFSILRTPSSPVLLTCVPPQASVSHPTILTTRIFPPGTAPPW